MYIIVPSQINPSPVNPVLQVQVKEPLVSVHTALMLQGLDLHPREIVATHKNQIGRLIDYA